MLLVSCDTKRYEECPPDRIVGNWGITRQTHAFGEYDSLYYIINPIGNVLDSLYYNGDYTDSYYHSDSTRVMLRYTTDDSIQFNIDRLYSVQTNPKNLLMTAKATVDSTEIKCELHLFKDSDDDHIYKSGPDSLFKLLLSKETLVKFEATNGPSTSEPSGSQNYVFFLNTKGFNRAFAMADSINNPAKYKKQEQKDSAENKKKEVEKEERFDHRRHHHRR